MEKQEVKRALEDFVDVLLETNTRQADWVTSKTELLAELKTNWPRLDDLMTAYPELPKRWCKTLLRTNVPEMMVVRRTDLPQWHQALAELNASKPRAVEAKAVEPKSVANGTAPLVLREGTPIMSPRDAEAIVHAQWDAKVASQANTKATDGNTNAQVMNTVAVDKLATAVERLSTSVDANTNQQRKTVEAMDALRKELHGPSQA